MRVAVLLSGGVDSSLSLALLNAAGHDVHAFYLKIWFQEDFRNSWDACPWEEDLRCAQEVRRARITWLHDGHRRLSARTLTCHTFDLCKLQRLMH